MQPHIQNTKFGSITITKAKFDHNIVIRLGGRSEEAEEENFQRSSMATRTPFHWPRPNTSSTRVRSGSLSAAASTET